MAEQQAVLKAAVFDTIPAERLQVYWELIKFLSENADTLVTYFDEKVYEKSNYNGYYQNKHEAYYNAGPSYIDSNYMPVHLRPLFRNYCERIGEPYIGGCSTTKNGEKVNLFMKMESPQRYLYLHHWLKWPVADTDGLGSGITKYCTLDNKLVYTIELYDHYGW